LFSRKKPAVSPEERAQHERSLRLAAGWAQGFERVHSVRTSAAELAASHEPICECLACRVVANDQRALLEMLDGSSGAAG
jgi:hypothetical protein